VRGAYVVNLLVGFDIVPADISKATTWKSDKVYPSAVDNRKLQITVKRCGIYHFPFHDGVGLHIKPTTAVI
jgi:hypothetical protein